MSSDKTCAKILFSKGSVQTIFGIKGEVDLDTVSVQFFSQEICSSCFWALINWHFQSLRISLITSCGAIWQRHHGFHGRCHHFLKCFRPTSSQLEQQISPSKPTNRKINDQVMPYILSLRIWYWGTTSLQFSRRARRKRRRKYDGKKEINKYRSLHIFLWFTSDKSSWNRARGI